MALHILHAVLEAAESFGDVRLKKALDQVLGVLVKVARELDLAGQDFLVDGHRVVVHEWGRTARDLGGEEEEEEDEEEDEEAEEAMR